MLNVVSTVDTADILRKSPLRHNYSITSSKQVHLSEEPSVFLPAENNLEGHSKIEFDNAPAKNFRQPKSSTSSKWDPPAGLLIPSGYHYNPKVSSTISILNRSDRYRNRLDRMNHAKSKRKSRHLFYWQAKRAEENAAKKADDMDTLSRAREWIANGKPLTLKRIETKRKKKEPPSWYVGKVKEERHLMNNLPEAEVRKQYTFLHYEKKNTC